MRIELQTHPKIVRILSATCSDKFRVIGGLHAVWGVFDSHSSDGKLFGYTPEALDNIIGWPGFSSAMIMVGWLTFDGSETLECPEFAEHNGKSAKRRAEDQKRKRDARDCPQSVRNLSENKPDKKRTREEKRREDIESTPKAERATATRLPADWSMSVEDCDFCVKTRPELNVLETAERFRDYWIAQPGAKGRKLDWHSTWRNWVRNEKAPARAGPNRPTLTETRIATLHALTGRNEWGNDERDIPGTCERIA